MSYRAVVYTPLGNELDYGSYPTVTAAQEALQAHTWGQCCPCVIDENDPERGDVSGDDE